MHVEVGDASEEKEVERGGGAPGFRADCKLGETLLLVESASMRYESFRKEERERIEEVAKKLREIDVVVPGLLSPCRSKWPMLKMR